MNCVRTKKLLEKKEISFIEKNIIEDQKGRMELKEWSEEVITPVLVNLETKELLKCDQIQLNF
ncbi:glutaredoxin family protein [Bacillus pinisoli]|uniref:glutaredoxin family protein n=1 Tax=Bacillus pinisoli TaxID=2901866 RepID=UPI003AEFE4A6